MKPRIAGGITSSTAERSPFPYEGKALTRRKVGEIYNIGQRGNASLAALWKVVIPTRSG